MILTETVSGRIEKYDYTQETWVSILTLSNANVISASSLRQCTDDNSFTIGGVYAASLRITVQIPAPWTSFQLRGCRLFLTSSLAGAIGLFYVVDLQRNGRFFTLRCYDTMAWTNTSSYSDSQAAVVGSVISYFPDDYSNTLQGWMNELHLTAYTNRFILGCTGVENLAVWEYYSQELNPIDIVNGGMLQFTINKDSGTADSDCPRDIFRYLAELAFGFVYAQPDTGNITLGQFAEPRYGTAEIQASEIEYDTAEFADYEAKLNRVIIVCSRKDGNKDSRWAAWSGMDRTEYAGFDITIEGNPFMEGSYYMEDYRASFLSDIAGALLEGFHRTEASAYAYHVVPFTCTVHGAHTLHLGQKVLIHHLPPGESVEQDYSSIITKIEWSLYGGQKISCSGGDSRSLSESLRYSKADKVRKDVQNHCDAIKRRTVALTQAEYDALTDVDEMALYAVLDGSG